MGLEEEAEWEADMGAGMDTAEPERDLEGEAESAIRMCSTLSHTIRSRCTPGLLGWPGEGSRWESSRWGRSSSSMSR